MTQPDPITVQAEIDDTVLIRLAQNITETEMQSDLDGEGEVVTGFEYDETMLQIPTIELPLVTNNFDAYFGIGLSLEADFDEPTLLWYHTLTNFLELKQTLVSINADDGSIELPIAPEPETIFVDKVTKEVALSTVTTAAFDARPMPIEINKIVPEVVKG
jgi:hypothetical protein